jgi:hypothetical protein
MGLIAGQPSVFHLGPGRLDLGRLLLELLQGMLLPFQEILMMSRP